MAAGDTRNIKLGTCKVFWNDVDLGLTIGGVEMSVETSTHETKVDQYGETVVSEIVTGRNITVKCPLAETTVENLVAIMPGAELVANGVNKKVVVKTGIGMSISDAAQSLRLHPIALADSEKSEDVTIPRAACPGAMSFAYKLDEERVFNAEFKGYPDPTDGVLFVVGDPAIAAPSRVEEVAKK